MQKMRNTILFWCLFFCMNHHIRCLSHHFNTERFCLHAFVQAGPPQRAEDCLTLRLESGIKCLSQVHRGPYYKSELELK